MHLDPHRVGEGVGCSQHSLVCMGCLVQARLVLHKEIQLVVWRILVRVAFDISG